LIAPTLPEVRRLILAMAGAEQEREFRLGWSLWRRAHQALAKRCHTARRALRREGALTLGRHTTRQARGSVPEPMVAPLTDEQWERIRPLMAPQEPPSGRPRRDHRVRYSRGCFGSSEPLLRGGICPKRSSGHGGRCMDATANGARKASGSG
jgi:hypothetical protein